MPWTEHQEWERAWHGNCVNTFSEEAKQITYAHRMGLVNVPDNKRWPVYDLGGKSVIDIGGGPSSLLLKTINVKRPTVIDPCVYPDWVGQRYECARIDYVVRAAEDLALASFDEAWIYNVLQHTNDPQKIVQNARSAARLVRMFEWVDTPPTPGHPHMLTSSQLNGWLDGEGKVELMNGENSCYGPAFYGVFPS